MKRIKLSLAFLCLCLVMCISSASAQNGTITVIGEQLNHIKNGDFVYPIEGVGELILSGTNGVTYEYSKTSWWGKERHRLVVNIGVGAIKIVAKDSNKRVKLRNVSISGYAHGTFAWSDVYLFDKEHYSRWNTDGNKTSPYETHCNDMNVWNACSMEVIRKPVDIISITVDYAVYQVHNPLVVSEDGYTQPGEFDYIEKIQLGRKIPAGWSTICLPFDCTTAEIGEGVTAHEFVHYDAATGLDFSAVEQLQANKPYLIYAPQEIAAGSLNFSARTMAQSTPQEATHSGMTFVGSYEGQISMQGKFGVANNKLIKGGAHSILKGTRAYFIYNAPSGQASSLNINIGGATTGIEQAEVAVQAVDGVYNLQGVCVRKGTSLHGLPKGIYIVNGKKCVVR